MFQLILEMFTYPFMVRALCMGVLVALCSALLGVTLVLKRYSMIGDGLSHVGFGALAVATAMNAAPLAVAVVALISTGALAVGVMVVSMTTGMNTDVYNYLFGSILSMSHGDVVLTGTVSAVILVLFVFFYNRIFAVTFDETFARATGLNVQLYNSVIAVLTALIIVVGMRMMGSLLISSLVVFPAVTSMRTCLTFRSVMICSAVVSTVCLTAGLVISYLCAAPTGASIVLCNIAAFILFAAVQKGRECLQSSKKSL